MRWWKQILSILLVCCLVVGLLPTTALAETSDTDITYAVTGGNIYFDAETGTITGSDSGVISVNIPHDINGVEVVAIASFAFSTREYLTSIVIPSNVVSVGTLAFQACPRLTDVTIASKYIGNDAFTRCDNLKNLILQEGVETIGISAFGGCGSLTSVTFPSTLDFIRGNAFLGCDNLKEAIFLGEDPMCEDNVFATALGVDGKAYPDGFHIYCYASKWNPAVNSYFNGIPCIYMDESSAGTGVGDNNTYLEDLPYSAWDRYTGNQGDSFIDKVGTRNSAKGINGKTYTHGLEAWVARWNFMNEVSWVWKEWDINETYNTLSGEINISSNCYNQTSYQTIIEIIGDDGVLYSYELTPDVTYPLMINIDVSGVSKLKIYLHDATGAAGGTSFILGDLMLSNSTGSEKVFTLGKDNLSFTNSRLYFFNTAELLALEELNAMGNILSGGFVGIVAMAGMYPNYQISDEAFNRLIAGMSNTVQNRLVEKRSSIWGGSCYGMAQVMAIRYLAPERLPLSEIDPSLTDNNSTYDFQAPKGSEATESLINYYHLAQFLPMQYAVQQAQCAEIADEYAKSLEHIVSNLRAGMAVPVSISKYEKTDDGGKLVGGHAVVLLSILDESDEYYSIQVCDPNNSEYTTLYIYKQTDLVSDAFEIAYSSSQNVNTESISYNVIISYSPSVMEMDLRNYFGIDDNAGYMTDYDTAHLITDLNASVSFTCGNVELQYENGVVRYSNNISNPYITANTTSDGESSSEVEFLFDKPSQDETSQLSVSAGTGNADITLILDGWSIAVMSENDITIQTNSENQSVAIQSEDAGVISAWLTQNETAENWPWYGIAVDVENATELSLTPTDSGIQISSDNLEGATVAGQSEDKIEFLTLTTESESVLLINKTTSDSDDNYIAIANKAITVSGATLDKYSVSVPSNVENGTVTVTPKSASKDTTVTITATPDAGYELSTLTVTDASGRELALTNKGNGTYTFTMPASQVTVTASFAEIGNEPEPVVNPFTDVFESDYYYDAVLWAVENGVTYGTSATTFSPDLACTRAQIVTFLWRAAGSPEPAGNHNPFMDVKASDYYYEAVLWAAENGITEGTSATTFSPDLACTRDQAVTFLWRAAGKPAPESIVNPFTDVKPGQYYTDAVLWAAENGITEGTSATTFSPGLTCTRAQIVTFLYRNKK